MQHRVRSDTGVLEHFSQPLAVIFSTARVFCSSMGWTAFGFPPYPPPPAKEKLLGLCQFNSDRFPGYLLVQPPLKTFGLCQVW